MQLDLINNGAAASWPLGLPSDDDRASWFEADGNAHFITDNRGLVLYVNEAGRMLLTTGSLRIDGRGRLVLPRSSGPLDDLLTRAAKSGEPQQHVYQLEQDNWLGVSVRLVSRLGLGRLMINVREMPLNKDIDLRPVAAQFGISECEAPVLRGLAQAVCPKEISRDLDLSIHTIRSHLRSIYAKLGVRTSAEAQKKVLHLYLLMQSM
jgi:DNA-binding CsgD family transcriptional regulator